jgi:hypothetical protein
MLLPVRVTIEHTTIDRGLPSEGHPFHHLEPARCEHSVSPLFFRRSTGTFARWSETEKIHGDLYGFSGTCAPLL